MTDEFTGSINLQLLAIETSNDACSAALLTDNKVTTFFEIAPKQHTKLILSMINSLLNDARLSLAQLDAIAFSYGPGSFTGIRLATSVAQGLAYGAKLPVLAISTLRVLAQRAAIEKNAKKVLVAIDAKMQEIYWGTYVADEIGIMQAAIHDTLCQPIDVCMPIEAEYDSQLLISKNAINNWVGVGNGWTNYRKILCQKLNLLNIPILDISFPRAQEVITIAVQDFKMRKTLTPEMVLPNYLRNNVTHAKK
jgi:tRNA threonylcarbamoyladenosine biosynthesis protein TsaB